MRVLMLSWEYPPLVEGGLARHVHKLSESLVDLGVEVHVLTRSGGESPDEDLVNGVVLHRVREPERPADLEEFVTWVVQMNLDMLAAGVEIARKYEFDLIHGHDWLVAYAGSHLGKLFDTPIVFTIHATEFGRHQGWVDEHPQSYIHGIEKWIVNRADRVIACSVYMREQIADIFNVDIDSIEVIYNGIDPRDLNPQSDLDDLRSQFARPDEHLILLLGRLVYEKGFQLALDAMPQVISELGNVRFIIAGSGTHEQELRKQVSELGLEDHGKFVGWIGDDVLHSLYCVADLTVVPSIYEPFGLVALEAMASGSPCIVADTGGLKEVVPNDDVGLRFKSKDPDSLAKVAIKVLSDDDLRRSLSEEGRKHISEFDWADVAKRTNDLYLSLQGAELLNSK